MAKLYLIAAWVEQEQLTDLPYHLKVEALTQVIGVAAYNSYFGRIGEWEIMTAEHVLSTLVGHNPTYLLCCLLLAN